MSVATNDRAFAYNGKIDKSMRYKWKIRNQPGEFMMLSKHLLAVDHSYQRGEKTVKARTIAQNFDWVAFGVLIVVLREGRYWIVDGQQRWTATMLHSSIGDVPCMVFETDGLDGEARAFLETNTLRKPVTAIEKFKAQCMVGDPHALAIDALIRSVEYQIAETSTTGRVVGCIRCLSSLHQRDPELLTAMWPLAVDVAQGGPILERVIEPLIYIEAWLQKNRPQHSLLRQPWRQRVLSLGARGIVDAGAGAASFYQRGGPRIWALGVGNALDKGVRHKLMIGSPEEV